MPSKTTTIGFACGRCFDVRTAHYEPDACFGCGARFDRGAPLAMLRLEIGVAIAGDDDGVGVAIDPRARVEFLGTWTAQARERTLAQLGAVEDEDAGRPIDARER